MNNKTPYRLLIIGAILAMSACSSVTIRNEGTRQITNDASWSKSEPFFLWGLAGSAHVDVNRICLHGHVEQLQTQRTFVDGLLAVITLGIYSPRTASVWCEGALANE